MQTVFMTLGRLGSLTMLLTTFILIYALLGVRLFTGLYPPHWESDGNFDTIETASITLFVLLTRENYPYCMYPALNVL